MIRCKDGIAYKYLLMILRNFEKQISSGGSGSIFDAIGKDEINKIELPLPPTLEDQIAIANQLENKMTEVEKMRRAAMRQKETVYALQDSILNKVFPYKEKDRLPEGWYWVKLGDIARLKNGINFDSSQVGTGTLTIDVFNMYSQDIFPILDNLYRVAIPLNEEYILRKDDILFVRSSVKREGVGWPTVFQEYNKPVTFCGFLIRARLNKKDIYAPYLVHYFRKKSVRESFILASGQSTITNINQENLKKVLIPLPDTINEQISIVEKLQKKLNWLGKIRDASDTQLEAIEALPAAILREVLDFQNVGANSCPQIN